MSDALAGRVSSAVRTGGDCSWTSGYATTTVRGWSSTAHHRGHAIAVIVAMVFLRDQITNIFSNIGNNLT